MFGAFAESSEEQQKDKVKPSPLQTTTLHSNPFRIIQQSYESDPQNIKQFIQVAVKDNISQLDLAGSALQNCLVSSSLLADLLRAQRRQERLIRQLTLKLEKQALEYRKHKHSHHKRHSHHSSQYATTTLEEQNTNNKTSRQTSIQSPSTEKSRAASETAENDLNTTPAVLPPVFVNSHDGTNSDSSTRRSHSDSLDKTPVSSHEIPCHPPNCDQQD